MNCKPGDLAIIVGASGDEPALSIMKAAIGRIVRCVRIVPASHGEFYCTSSDNWLLENPVEISIKSWPSRIFYIEAISDSLLRPIREQYDDAVDEMLTIAGYPEKLEA